MTLYVVDTEQLTHWSYNPISNRDFCVEEQQKIEYEEGKCARVWNLNKALYTDSWLHEVIIHGELQRYIPPAVEENKQLKVIRPVSSEPNFVSSEPNFILYIKNNSLVMHIYDPFLVQEDSLITNWARYTLMPNIIILDIIQKWEYTRGYICIVEYPK